MFFFIGGIQPKTKALDDAVRVCPACGRMTLRHQRTDRYLSLFFIPMALVKRGIPYYTCENCGAVHDEAGGIGREAAPSGPGACRFCGRRLDGDFLYCPSCGKTV